MRRFPKVLSVELQSAAAPPCVRRAIIVSDGRPLERERRIH